MKMEKRRLAMALFVTMVLILTASTASAGDISYVPITGDEDCGISTDNTYTHAIDFGSTDPVPVNDVVFAKGVVGDFPPIGDTSQTVGTGTHSIGDINPGWQGIVNATGNIQVILADMVSDFSSPMVVTLTGLTSGQQYKIRLYNHQWGNDPGARTTQIGFDTNGAVAGDMSDAEDTASFSEDDATAPDPSFDVFNQVYALEYVYKLAPGVTTLTIHLINLSGGGSYHLYALTNEVFIDKMHPSPEDGSTVMATDSQVLSWTNLPSGPDSNDVYVDVWFGTEPNELHPAADFDLIVDGKTSNDGKNRTSVVVDANDVDTFYWQVNSYLGADKRNDANMIEGSLWSFNAVDDGAPTVGIDTPAQMTWSGQGVSLDADVLNDSVSTTIITWSADLSTGLTASFIPGPDPEDTTVTITKVAYSEALITNAGFEDPPLADGDWDTATGAAVPAWTEGYYTGAGTSWEPFDEFCGMIDTVAGVAEGENAAWCEIVPSSHSGLSQNLKEVLQANTDYTLNVEVGTPTGTVTPASYRIQLLVGEIDPDDGEAELLVVKEIEGVAPAADTWVPVPLNYSTGSGDPNIGLPFTIRLIAKDNGVGGEVYFDDVSLTANPPFPPSPGLSGITTVTVTVEVTDAANPVPGPAAIASVEVDVYDNACHMARVGQGMSAITDLSGNCITGLEELLLVVGAWLDDYSSSGPLDR